MLEYVFQSASAALVNALIHRDYMMIGSEVHIDIFDDHMEIYSPSGTQGGTQDGTQGGTQESIDTLILNFYIK